MRLSVWKKKETKTKSRHIFILVLLKDSEQYARGFVLIPGTVWAAAGALPLPPVGAKGRGRDGKEGGSPRARPVEAPRSLFPSPLAFILLLPQRNEAEPRRRAARPRAGEEGSQRRGTIYLIFKASSATRLPGLGGDLGGINR